VSIGYVVGLVCCCISVDAREAGEGKLEVAITDSNGQPLISEVVTDGLGAYAISYTPNTTGTHRVDIYFNGEYVTGKPRSVCFMLIMQITRNHNNVSSN